MKLSKAKNLLLKNRDHFPQNLYYTIRLGGYFVYKYYYSLYISTRK